MIKISSCRGGSETRPFQNTRRPDSSNKHLSIFVIILLLGAGLRFHALGQDTRFHPDEALFATFARSAAVFGDWMLPGALDKTPLSIYAAAISMHFTAAHITEQNIIDVGIRQGEFAARLPNTFAGILFIAIMARLSFSLSLCRAIIYHAPTGKPLQTFAASRLCGSIFLSSFTALSPYLIVFSASAFTDTFMLLFMIASLAAMLERKPAWSGLFLAMGIASKQQAIMYLPLVLAAGWIVHRVSWRDVLRFLLPFCAGIALLLLWDSARPETSLFTLASVNNNPEQFFAPFTTWGNRLLTWLNYLQWSLGTGMMTTALVIIALFATLRKPNRFNLLLWGYIVTYLIAHTVISFQPYDRYILPIIPLLILLASQGAAALLYAFGRNILRPYHFSLRTFAPLRLCGSIFLLLCLLLPSAWNAATGQLNIGRDHYPRQTQIIELAEYLNTKPLGAIIYDYWSGWELGYYMGAWTDKRRTYYPLPEVLAEDSLKNPDPAPRYLVNPVDKEAAPWLEALRTAGYKITLDYQSQEYQVFRLIPPWAVSDA